MSAPGSAIPGLAVPAGVSIGPAGPPPFLGPYGPTFVNTTTQDVNSGNYGVSQQYQRGSFTALGLSWVFYTDDPFSGSPALWYATSDDDGQTWTVQGEVRSVPGGVGGGRAFDVHFDGTYIHLAIGDSPGFYGGLKYARGTPDGGGGITWDADQTVEDDGAGKWEVSINTDADGNPWIAWESWSGGNATPRVSGSTTSDGTWTTRAGHPLDLSDAGTAPFVTLCWTFIGRLDDSGGMICFFWFDANVYARVWNGSSWGAYEGPIDTPSHDNRQEDIAFVTDSVNGIAYAVWADNSTGTYAAIRDSGGSWTVESATSDDGRSFAVAIDGDGALHVFSAISASTSSISYLVRDSGGIWTDNGTIIDISPEEIVPIGLQVSEMSRDGRLVVLFQAQDPSDTLAPDNVYTYTLGATAAVGGSGGGGGPQSVSIARVTQVNTARALTHSKKKAVARVSETSTARSLTRIHARAVTRVGESNVTRNLAATKVKSIGRVTETDTARTVAANNSKFISLTRVIENDLVRTLAAIKTKALGRVIETNSSRTLTSVHMRSIARVVETNTARSLTFFKKFLLQRVAETDTARTINLAGHKNIALVRVSEADTTRALTESKQFDIAKVIETNSARALTFTKAVSFSRVVEVDTARILTAAKMTSILRVTELNTTQPFTFLLTHRVARVIEIDTARPLIAQLKSTLGGPPQRTGRITVALPGRLQAMEQVPGRIT